MRSYEALVWRARLRRLFIATSVAWRGSTFEDDTKMTLLSLAKTRRQTLPFGIHKHVDCSTVLTALNTIPYLPGFIDCSVNHKGVPDPQGW